MATKFTYFGGMCIMMEREDGYKILCDPYLSKNPATETSPESVSDIDLLLVTHNAFDHFGDTIEIMKNSSAILFCGQDVLHHVLEEIPDLDESRYRTTIYGDEQRFGNVEVRVMQAWHVSNYAVNGTIISNPAFGFVVDVEPGVCYYHAGDTSLYTDMRMIREMYKPTVMAVGITGITKQYPVEMNPREAAYATQWIGPDVVIPTHYAPGAEELELYCDYVKVTSPKTIVKREVDQSWTYVPFVVK